MKRLVFVLVVLVAVVDPSWADELPDWVKNTKISGYMFGDAYWVAGNHDEQLEGENGFWFRRVYLTFDYKLGEDLSARLRFEANSPGDFSSNNKLEPFVKDAYVNWKRDREQLYLGISSTPTWGVVEKAWGYRAVEKTPLDVQKLGSSRDFGVALKGRFGSAGKVRYHAMLGNGSGTKGETNEGKKGMLSVAFYPSDSFTVEAYGDFDNRPGETDRTTYQVFATYKGEWGRVGIQGARQRREVQGGETLNLDIASAFAVIELSDRASVLARYDRMFDPNPDGAGIAYIPFDPTAKSDLVIIGLDFKAHETFSLIPNVEWVFYNGVGGAPDPDDDLIGRLTFFFRF